MPALVPVILSGGSGTRLWPRSRSKYPKQFINFFGENSLFEDTVSRITAQAGINNIVVVANEEHRFIVASQMQSLPDVSATLLLEPMPRNTALAIAVAAHAVAPDALLLVLPSDHRIAAPECFMACVNAGMPYAAQGNLVTFGIVPTEPSEGYGYIHAPASAGTGAGRNIERFVEKPKAQAARQMLADGHYYWNSGMFLFRADIFLEELASYANDIWAASAAIHAARYADGNFTKYPAEAYRACRSQSVDYAVMEHTKKGIVIPMDAGWNDVGTWSSIWQEHEKDDDGNVIIGDVETIGSKECLLVAGENRLVAAIDVHDLIIVDTEDATLVAHRNSGEKIKELVALLEKKNRVEIEFHKTVHRPWGSYTGIDNGMRDKVKRIIVKPGGQLSLQMHNHRAEHWVVVKGKARVTRGDDIFDLNENESTYIPKGVRHRLENCGDAPLEIIEVQTGGYLEEDDIVRYDDQYGRS